MKREIPQKVDAPFNCVAQSRFESTSRVGATLFRRTRSASVLSITLTATALGFALPQKSVSAYSALTPRLLGTLTALPQSGLGEGSASSSVRGQSTNVAEAAGIDPLQPSSWSFEDSSLSTDVAFSTTPNALSGLDPSAPTVPVLGGSTVQGQVLDPAEVAAAIVPHSPAIADNQKSAAAKLGQKVIPNPGGILLRASGALVHTVEKGENLTEIADKYRVSPDAIAKTNRIDDPNVIDANEDLVILPTTLSAATSGVIAAALVQEGQLRPLAPAPRSEAPAKVFSAPSGAVQGAVPSAGAVAVSPAGVRDGKAQPAAIATPPLMARRSLFPQIPPLDLPPLNSAEQFLPSVQRGINAFQRFVWPAQGMFTSGYGWRWGRMHRGIDIAAPVGTPIMAAASGTVVTAGWNDGGFGNFVEIRHPDGSLTRYAHNSTIETRVGATVTQGQLIARMGSTGRSTGPHLHFEIRPSGQGSVDPMFFLARR